MNKTLIIFNGSPRKNKTSFSFARTITALAEERGYRTEIVHVIEYFDGKKSIESLRKLIVDSEVMGLISPLYVDCLPSYVIWFFEALFRELKAELNGKGFFAIGQCGFPDITMNEPLLESSRLFAEAVGMKWLGGLSYGGGAMLEGAHLENLGKKGEKITLAFKLALEDLLEGRFISSKPQELLTVKIPGLLMVPLIMVMNFRAKREAKKKGIGDIGRRVYLE